jgi:hypothetical protein
LKIRVAIFMLVSASLKLPGPLKSLGLFGGPTIFMGVHSSDLGLLGVLVEVVHCLGALACPGCWMPPVFASLSFAFTFFSFRLAHPDGAFFTRRCPTPVTKCCDSLPTTGKLAVLAPCGGMSATLAPIREVPGFTSGRFHTTGLFLPLAEAPTAGSLIATSSLNGTLEFSCPPPSVEGLLVESLYGSPSFS